MVVGRVIASSRDHLELPTWKIALMASLTIPGRVVEEVDGVVLAMRALFSDLDVFVGVRVVFEGGREVGGLVGVEWTGACFEEDRAS
jgi:hypothetical protein